MADIIQFPGGEDKDDRGIAAEIARFLVGRGTSASAADQQARELVPRFRAFERSLAASTITVQTETDRERQLVTDLGRRFADLAKEVWIASALGAPYAARK